MTEYWKSYAKKFCDVCKCWIADNKISISVHEGGKKHQENVKNKINDLVKKSSKEFKEKKKMDSEMHKMEEEAMAAYLRDVEENPDMSSEILKDTLAAKLEKIKDEKPVETPKEVKKDKKKGPKSVKSSGQTESSDNSKPSVAWYEAKSEEGHTYFWNSVTNESIWEPPPEGFISLDEQREMEEKQKLLAKEAEANKKEIEAALERSKMEVKYKEQIEKNLKDQKEAEEAAAAFSEEVKAGTASIGPTKRPCGPYGKWTTVSVTEQTPVNLDLPEQQKKAVPVIAIPISERVKIKEKTWSRDSLSDMPSNEPVTFKKRKFGGNVRRRQDDD